MVIVGLLCILVYRGLKVRTFRPRPYRFSQAITCNARPLDPYSFPSGHTLHAVAFTTIASARYPQLVWLLVPFTLLVALSRMVLGVHYPSDVFAGCSLGAFVAGISLYF